MKIKFTKFYKTSVLLFFAALALVFTITQVQASEITMIVSNDTNNKGLKGQTFDFLVEEVRKRLGDRIDVQMFHAGTLFDQQSQIQGLQLGEAHIISPTTGIYSSVTPKVGALNLPFMLSDPEKINVAVKDPIVRGSFMPEMNSKNIEIVAVWMNGPRVFGYKGDKPILLPEEAKGVKIRVQSAPIFVKTWTIVGANAVGVSWSEVPTALQQGVIDAAEPTPNAWRGSGNYQMIDHLTMTNHQYSFYLVGANKQWWDGLPADVKTEVQAALDAATDWNIKKAMSINEEATKFIAESGVKIHQLNDEQRAAWAKAMKPVWDELGNKLVGEEVIARMKEIAGVK